MPQPPNWDAHEKTFGVSNKDVLTAIGPGVVISVAHLARDAALAVHSCSVPVAVLL